MRTEGFVGCNVPPTHTLAIVVTEGGVTDARAVNLISPSSVQLTHNFSISHK